MLLMEAKTKVKKKSTNRLAKTTKKEKQLAHAKISK